MNADQVSARSASFGPVGFLESRTGTMPVTGVRASATSRQSPPSPPLWLDLRQL